LSPAMGGAAPTIRPSLTATFESSIMKAESGPDSARD
jgi:hypothetical protein